MAQQQEYGLQTTEGNRKHTVLWAFMAAIPLLALLGMEMATLKIASDYSFHPMLGQPWFSVLGVPVYAPWRVFTWEGISQPVMDNALVLGQAFFLLPLFLALLCVVAARRLKGNQELHGSARWARKAEIERMGYLGGQGVYVGGWFDKKRTYYAIFDITAQSISCVLPLHAQARGWA